MRWSAFICLLCLSSIIHGQSRSSKIDQRFIWPNTTQNNSHFTDSDSTERNSREITLKPHLNYVLNGGLGVIGATAPVGNAYVNTGFKLKHRNLSLTLRGEAVQGEFGNYMSDFIDSTGVISGFGVATQNDLGYFSHRITGNLNWQVSKHFNAELGNGTNFWGNGYRSVVLGNNAAPYPYLKLTTDVWRIKYVNLFAQQRNFTETLNRSNARVKYSALHALDFKVSDSFSLTIFEAVIWQSSDTLSNRGFEANYLNPIIFYRPVEFSQGSADNVLLGIAARLQLEENFLWYGQFFLDEFLLSAVRARSGWWANKLGVQLGVRIIDYIPKVNAYSELNMARPFTYTHGSVIQNYGHLNQSLAHPLGTNFVEWSTGAEYQNENWRFAGRFNWAVYGRDRAGQNFGGDIFRSYASPARTFGNYIGQGNTHHSYFLEANATRALNKQKSLWLSLNYAIRHVKSNYSVNTEQLIRIGLASSVSSLINRDRDVYVPTFVQDF